MNRAIKLTELHNVLKPEALTIENMPDFYCDKTMEVRTGHKYESPTLDMFDSIMMGDSKKAFLFMGHRGCGKSTELNELNIKLSSEGFEVATIYTSLELDMLNMAYWDLLILIGQKIIEIAKKTGCHISNKILQRIESFWYEAEIEKIEDKTLETGLSLGIQGDVSQETKANLLSIAFDAVLGLFSKISADMKFNIEKRKTIRYKLEQRAAEWIEIINVISDSIARELNGKYPVIIFEDLDKIDTEIAWSIFHNYAYAMSQVPVHIIYTFPIALSYSPKFGAVAPFFKVKSLPMIKLHFHDMTECSEGIKIIEEILFLRADESLFSSDALHYAIINTGGCLRDLFNILLDASTIAHRRNSIKIELEDVKYQLDKFSSILTKRIQANQYDFLKTIYDGDKFQIKDREILLEMMQAQVVLEYNGVRWHDVHPLVSKFLEEQRLV